MLDFIVLIWVCLNLIPHHKEGVNDVYKMSVRFMASQVVQDTFFHKGSYGRLGCQCERHTRTLLLAVLDQVR